MATPTTELRKLHQTSPFIELFKLDCSAIGGATYHFTPNVTSSGGSIAFGGITYLPLPIQTTGWEFTANGTQARPTLTVSNVNQTLLNAVVTLKDLRNARVVRTRTFEKFLDGQPTADSTAYINPVDVYYVFQKTAHNKNVITWVLANEMEAFKQRVPARQFLKDGPGGFPGINRIRGSQ